MPMPAIRDIATHPYPFVTVQEFATYLMVDPKTIYRHIEKGALPAVKVGGVMRIPIAEARAYVTPRNGTVGQR